jgi:hypothetical protein
LRSLVLVLALKFPLVSAGSTISRGLTEISPGRSQKSFGGGGVGSEEDDLSTLIQPVIGVQILFFSQPM